MSIRLRKTDAGLVAVCAARSIPLPGDIYLDDAAHHALSLKFERDFAEMGFLPVRDFLAPPPDGVEDRRPLVLAMDEAESNNPNRAEWDRVYS